jgi:hypothetical protein
MIKATVMTVDGRIATLMLFHNDVQSEQDYRCEPAKAFTLAEVQKLAKALCSPSAANPISRDPETDDRELSDDSLPIRVLDHLPPVPPCPTTIQPSWKVA